MSLKFNEAIKIVVEELLETPKPKYQLYSQDAAEISAKMDQELININSIFKGTVSNWDETIELSKTELPKLQIPVLRLNMPFTVEPQRVLVFSSDKVQPVNLKTSVNHPAVENGYLNGEKLTQLFIWDLNRVIDRISKITCSSGKIYKLFFGVKSSNGGTIILISAMENDSHEDPSFFYSFFPSFIFTNKSSNYIYSSHFFHQSDNADAKKFSKEYQNLKILLHTLLNQSSNVSIFNLKFAACSIKIEPGMETGSVLLEAIPLYIRHVQNPGPLISAYGKLLQLKQLDSVQLSEIKKVFGLK